MKSQPLHRRILWALAGWRECWRTEGSFRTQCAFAAAGLALLAWLRPAPVWWALAVLAAALVLAAELFNSALERLADRLHPERHPDIGALKDMAAGAVFVLALAGLAVAVLAVASVL
jgi:diacylglycerol kinase (ATP)